MNSSEFFKTVMSGVAFISGVFLFAFGYIPLLIGAMSWVSEGELKSDMMIRSAVIWVPCLISLLISLYFLTRGKS